MLATSLKDIRRKRKIRILKIVYPIFIAILFLLSFVTPVLAISTPDSVGIYNVWVYRNAVESGDQLYIVDFFIEYETNPDENAQEAFIIRLLDESNDEIGSSTPCTYYNNGYARGVAFIYFDADNAPFWEGDYTMQLVGNPTLEWTPSIPNELLTSFNWNDATTTSIVKEVIAGRIIWLAGYLDSDWSETAYSLLENTIDGQYLSENGISYFATVLAKANADLSLQVLAPDALSFRHVDLDYNRTDTVLYDYDQSYADQLMNTTAATSLDVSDGAGLLGVSRGMLTGFLYYGCIFLGFIKFYPQLQSTKPLTAILIPLAIAGSFIGVPLQVVIVASFIAFLMVGYALLYKNAAA